MLQTTSAHDRTTAALSVTTQAPKRAVFAPGLGRTEVNGASLRPDTRQALLLATPKLRAFALSLCHNPDQADDLVQDTLVQAIANLDRFEEGTNLNAWLFTILRNRFYSLVRKRRNEVEDRDGEYAARLATPAEQGANLDFQDFRRAFRQLTDEQREALLLVGASGVPYEEAAAICGVAIGTIKSRVNRARRRLTELLSLDGSVDFSPTT
jgi:RNA polymerase sigma-70 factor, ECF subfamily